MNTVITNVLKYCFIILGLMGGLEAAIAQESDDRLGGYWKKKGASVYIKVVNNEGVYEAEIVRNDWFPGLVGTRFFHNVVPGKKNRWVGEVDIPDSEKTGKATLRIKASGELASRLRPGGSAIWLRSEPVEKRY